MEIADLPLLPGNYEFTVGINDNFLQHTYDRQYRAHPLAVRRGEEPVGIGFTQMPSPWSLLPWDASAAAQAAAEAAARADALEADRDAQEARRTTPAAPSGAGDRPSDLSADQEAPT